MTQQEYAVLPADQVWWQRLFKRLILGGMAVFILLAGLPLQAQAASLLPASQNSVLGKPTVSAAFINRVLVTYHSPAAGKGQALYEDGVTYGIDPVFALAFFLHESTFGTAGVAQQTRSLGNIRCTAGYPTCYAGYRAYPSWEEGFLDWYKLIRTVYVTQWRLTTVEQILPVYAPASENNVGAYIAAVNQAVAIWRAGQVLIMDGGSAADQVGKTPYYQ
jgi:hypothetical protein